MEIKEVIDALDPKLKEYKEQVAAEAKKNADALQATVDQLNEDAKKTNDTLGDVLDKVKTIQAKQGKVYAAEAEAANDFKSLVMKGISDNFEAIGQVRKGNAVKFDIKAVGDSIATYNLTGNGVATYAAAPSLRGRRKVAFRDIPGVQVVNSATGIWKYYKQDVPAGEGSFGNQTIGSAKPQLDYDFTETTVTVNTLAGFVRVAKQALRDLPFMNSFLPGELQEDYLRAESNSFINTLMAATSAYSFTSSVYAEMLIEAIAAVYSRDYEPTSIVTTAANWGVLLSTKPSDYSVPGGISINPMGDVLVAGVPVVIANNMSANRTFIGDFSRVKILQANGLSIQFFEQDSDNVQKNLVTVRAEADVALAVLRSDWGVYMIK